MRSFLLCSILFGALATTALASAPVFSFPSADQTLVAQLVPYGGTGLTVEQCDAHLTDLEAMFKASDFGPRQISVLPAGRRVMRWYSPSRDTTILAFVDKGEFGRTLQLTVLPWRDLMEISSAP